MAIDRHAVPMPIPMPAVFQVAAGRAALGKAVCPIALSAA
jgi:hypothetical protein